MDHLKANYEGLVELAGINLFVRQFGSAGPNVIIIHGGPDWDHSYLLPFARCLSKISKLTYFDIRACGRSSKPLSLDGLTKDDIVEDIAALLKKLKIDRAIILGFSFGGRVAIKFAAKYGSYVQSLILASTTAFDDYQNELNDWLEYKQRCRALNLTERMNILHDERYDYQQRSRLFIESHLYLDIYDKKHLNDVKKLVANMLISGCWLEAWIKGKLKEDGSFIYHHQFSLINVPILIIHGEKDMRFPVSVAYKLKNKIPNAELAILKNTGHLAHVESLEAWTDSVFNFILKSSK